jgi:hypothetical protein
VKFQQILCDSSKKVAEMAASFVIDEPERIHPLTELILANDFPYSERAARVLAICSERFPEFFEEQQNRIIPWMKKVKSEGVIRNILKIVADYPVRLTKRNKGILLALCFDWLGDLSRPVAIRVHSMQYLFSLSRSEQGIRDELISILEDGYADGSAGFQSRATKILKQLYHY